MTYRSYAKINLGLRIINKRQDGYHNLETIFYKIGLFDEVTIEPTDGEIVITSPHKDVPLNDSNLCWKAVRLLQNELKTMQGASIHLKKNIPIGAGLGGGSSNATIIVKYLPVLWNQTFSLEQQTALALRLGSDVPFFLMKSNSYAEGRGEKLTEINFPLPYWIVVVNPNIHVSTPWAYMSLAEARGGNFPVRASLLEDFRRRDLSKILTNDFEPVVFEHYPVTAQLKQELLTLGAAYALMSGSGSSVFGLFETQEKAQRAAENFAASFFVHITEPNFLPEE